MGLLAFGFDHLPQDYIFGTPTKCYGLQATGMSCASIWAAGVGDDTTGNLACLRVKDGFIQMGKKPGTTATCAGKSTIPFKDLIGGAGVQPNKVIVGFRCTRFNVPVGSTPIFSISGDQTNGQPYLGMLPIIMNEATDVLNSPKYYEVEIDLIARTWKVFTDNVQTSNGTLDAGITKANFSQLYWQMGSLDRYFVSLNTEGASLWGIQHIYVSVATDTVGDTEATRLGPIVVTRATVKSDNGAPWAVSGAATIPEALSTRRTSTGTLSSPYIVNDAAKTPLRVKLDTSGIPGGQIHGVSVSFSAFTVDATPVTLEGKLDQAGTTSTPVTVTAGNTSPVVDTKVGNFKVLPGGVALTKANLADTEIVLTAL